MYRYSTLAASAAAVAVLAACSGGKGESDPAPTAKASSVEEVRHALDNGDIYCIRFTGKAPTVAKEQKTITFTYRPTVTPGPHGNLLFVEQSSQSGEQGVVSVKSAVELPNTDLQRTLDVPAIISGIWVDAGQLSTQTPQLKNIIEDELEEPASKISTVLGSCAPFITLNAPQ